MELACDAVVPGLGCDFVARGDTADAVHAAMMEHGGATHANLLEGMSAEVANEEKVKMDAHIRQLIAASA